MSELTNVFSDIADSIRSKTGTQDTYKPAQMAAAINNIETGGGEVEITADGSLSKSFNSPVNISDSVTNCYSMFNGCSNFNQPVNIPNGVTNCREMFIYCPNFSQPINIPNGVTDCAYMFWGCSNLNQPVNIPNSVTRCGEMFSVCSNFNQPINIPNSVTSCGSMFWFCRNISDIYFPNTSSNISVKAMLNKPDYKKRVNIYCTDATPFITKTDANSIVGANITWTPMSDGNGYYSDSRNIYIYNNYSPA